MFSIIIPLYNKSQYVLRAINSVLNQSFKDWELIIIDDGSTDDGPSKVLPFVSEKVHLIQQVNKGVSSARNYGIQISKKPYIAFLDADDYWHIDYLFRISEAISSFPEAGIWATKYVSDESELENNSSNFVKIANYFSTELERKFLLLTSAVVLDKSFFENNKGFNEKLTRGEDRDVWYRAICFFGKPIYSNSPLVYYSKEDENSLVRTKFPITKHIISILGKNDYCRIYNKSIDPVEFENFRIKIVYFDLVKFFSDYNNIDEIKIILSKMAKKFPLMFLFYSLPNQFLFWFFTGERRKKWFLRISRLLYF